MVCFSSGKYGHAKEKCSAKKEGDVGSLLEKETSGGQLPNIGVQPQQNNGAAEDNRFGSWMMVERKIK